jgi:Helicase conserved C-terminal domain
LRQSAAGPNGSHPGSRMISTMTSAEVRSKLVDALRLDLIGPSPGHELENEILPSSPSRWYLTGFLVPHEAAEEQRGDQTADEQLELAAVSESADDDAPAEQVSKRRAFFPSSIGISALVRNSTQRVTVVAEWGHYKAHEVEENEGKKRTEWRRAQHAETIGIQLGDIRAKPKAFDVPNSDGLRLVVSLRSLSSTVARAIAGEGEPCDCRAMSIFLVNERAIDAEARERKDERYVFQASLRVTSEESLVPRPDLRGMDGDDRDERIADLQYRDTFEYAVGHGVSTQALLQGASCREIRTEWIPEEDVERVNPAEIPAVELRMTRLAAAEESELRGMLTPLVGQYGSWIAKQREKAPSGLRRRDTLAFLIDRASNVKRRIGEGIELLNDPQIRDAFQTANRAMAAAATHRQRQASHTPTEPTWRPFQLAFILMNLRGIADPAHFDREVVDLLFFPTGGGKTEAYLGLVAFTLVLRRLRNPGVLSAGVSVLMRYTLRLLTLDQLARGATMICALELERKQMPERLGSWPFEIGLWVGSAATPNVMGKRGDNNTWSARSKVDRFKRNSASNPSPIPLENCPWCGTKFTSHSFHLVPNDVHPSDLRITCANRDCPFTRDNPLPILAVDEPIYRRVPCFIVATVDKFAMLPWVGRSGALLGKVDRYDRNGFYGPCDPGVGHPLEKPLLPPDLVIQDELHLISGPLGTMAGLYETAIDALMTRTDGGIAIRPKIVASTATVRRAEAQIRALFGRRNGSEVFPPPGPDRRDSFFARTASLDEGSGRRYIGVAAPGRSLKVVLLRSYLALLSATQKIYEDAGGAKNANNPADPYMTLLGYFNALRELGGSRRIVEDEVRSRLTAYGERKRVGQTSSSFANRHIDADVLELTSREPTNKVSETKRRLGLAFQSKEHVDVALATNMISVGLDITRLGLMVVLGQPKAAAEYIQATSRVGREESKPGLVVTLFNINRPRDRSHYERFEFFHQTFYRAVEATSVTPFAPRAIDRGLAAVTVAAARHGVPDLTAPLAARDVEQYSSQLELAVAAISARASEIGLPEDEAAELTRKLRGRVAGLLDDWKRIAHDMKNVTALLQYNRAEEAGAKGLLRDLLDPELPTLPPRERRFKANRSLRDVEQSVNIFMKALDHSEVPEEMA